MLKYSSLSRSVKIVLVNIIRKFNCYEINTIYDSLAQGMIR